MAQMVPRWRPSSSGIRVHNVPGRSQCCSAGVTSDVLGPKLTRLSLTRVADNACFGDASRWTSVRDSAVRSLELSLLHSLPIVSMPEIGTCKAHTNSAFVRSVDGLCLDLSWPLALREWVCDRREKQSKIAAAFHSFPDFCSHLEAGSVVVAREKAEREHEINQSMKDDYCTRHRSKCLVELR